jgi:hypothetical protein
MANYLFSYRMPRNYQPGRPDAMAAWVAWFEGMGSQLVEAGQPVFESQALGNCGPHTRAGGYSIISADSLAAAISIAKGCPALDDGAGVEVGELVNVGAAAGD